MALLDSEGWGLSTNFTDYETCGAWGNPSGTAPTIGTGGPLGDNYATLGGSGPEANRLFAAPVGPTFYWGARVKSAGNEFFAFYDPSGAIQFYVVLNPGGATSGQIAVYRGGNPQGTTGTLLGTSAGNSFNTSGGWFYLEVGATIATGTSGSVTVRVDGSPVLTLAGVTTQNSATYSTMQQLIWGSFGGGSMTHMYLCDNSGTLNNSFLGDVRVQTLFPTGAGGTTQFTPVGKATNWQNAATVPPAPATDYNESATVGATDLFALSGLDPTFATIPGINVKGVYLRSTSGTRSMAGVVKSNATTSTGPSFATSTSETQVGAIFQTDPNTGAAWTGAGLAAAQPGYTVTA